MNERRTEDRSQRAKRPLLAVLTGGVASGKSIVSDRFAALGAEVIDTDVLAREVVEPGEPGLEQVTEAFGNDVLAPDGSLDRRRLREIVFSDADNRRRLEGIVHPLIEARARERLQRAAGAPYALLVVPLLVESGLFADADCVIVVDVDEQTQIKRLMARDGIDEEQARAMLKAQAGRQDRLAVADEVLDNSGSPEALIESVDRIHQRLLEKAGSR